MPLNSFRFLLLILALTALTALGACRGATSPAVRFYTLSPVFDGTQASNPMSQGDSPTIGVGPLLIPREIDRPNIVTRTAQGEMHIDEFHRWAGTMEDSILGLLTQDIALELNSELVVAHPWTNFIDPDYRVPITIMRLDGELGGEVTLEATWGVTPRDQRRAAVVHRSSIKQATTGTTYADLVAAHDRALSTLAKTIVAEIIALRAAGQ